MARLILIKSLDKNIKIEIENKDKLSLTQRRKDKSTEKQSDKTYEKTHEQRLTDNETCRELIERVGNREVKNRIREKFYTKQIHFS